MRSLGPLLFVPAALAGGCTCGSKSSTAPVQPPAASVETAPPASGNAPGAASAAPLDAGVFSAPIAGTRVGHVDVVAGLVASEGVVRALAIAGGKPVWAVDALRGVSWAPDAEIRLRPAGDGVALVWRGPRAGKSGRVLTILGPRGESRGEPIEVGASLCTTADGLAWMDARATGSARVLARRWSETVSREIVAVSPDRDPALVCGDHAVLVLGDGDDDVTATSFVPGEAAAQPPRVVSRDGDFGDDDERDHYAYAVEDDLGLVRVGASGAVALREMPRGGGPGAWRKLKQTIPPDDDVVAVDGDADATLLVFTHDADDACPGIGSTAEGVRALRVDRRTGAEAVLDLAPPDCDRSPGPFWIASSPGGPTVAWVERAAKAPAKTPAIAAVALRTMAGGAVNARRIDLQADAVSDSGCDDAGCSIAALLRPPGGDGMQPETIAVFAYP
jgi:hypothetical protein